MGQQPDALRLEDRRLGLHVPLTDVEGGDQSGRDLAAAGLGPDVEPDSLGQRVTEADAFLVQGPPHVGRGSVVTLSIERQRLVPQRRVLLPRVAGTIQKDHGFVGGSDCVVIPARGVQDDAPVVPSPQRSPMRRWTAEARSVNSSDRRISTGNMEQPIA